MTCPQCGANNAGGRLFCIKCGAEMSKLSGTVGSMDLPGHPAGKRRRKRGVIAYLFYALILIVLAAVVLAVLPPGGAEVTTSEKAAREFELQRMNLQRKGPGRVEYTAAFTAEQLNSYLKEGYLDFGLDEVRKHVKDNVTLEDMQVELDGDRIKGHMRFFVEYKPVRKAFHVTIGGTLSGNEHMAVLAPGYLRVGRLVLPPKLASRVMSLLKKGDPLSLELPRYVTDLEVKDGKLTIKAN